MFKILLKMRMTALISSMFRRSKRSLKAKGSGKKVLMTLLAVYVVGCLFFVFGTMFSTLCTPLVDAGLSWLYFAVTAIFAFILCFLGSVFMIQTQLYEAKDNEMLLAMPIPPRVILASRMIVILAVNYIYEMFVLIPAIVIYAIKVPMTPAMILAWIIGFLILPFFVMIFSSIFGWILGLLMSRVRRKNIITLFFSVTLLIVYLYGYSRVQQYLLLLIQNGAEVGAAVKKALFPLYCFGMALGTGSLLHLLLFFLCTAIPFGLVYMVLASSFLKIAVGKKGAARIKYVKKTLKKVKPQTALLKKELSHLGSNPMYMLNAGLGCIFTVILAVLVLVKRNMLLEYLNQIPAAYTGPMICIALACLASLNVISAPSISLEGKNLWIAQTLPVDYGDIMMAKVKMHVAVGLPPIILVASICSFVLPMSIPSIALLYLLPAVLTVAMGLFGVIVNLRFPRFDWVSETAVVKQGMSVIITMFSSMGMLFFLGIIYVITGMFFRFFPLEAFLAVSTVFLAILCWLMAHYLRTKGKQRFEKLS